MVDYGMPTDIDRALLDGIRLGYFVSDELQPELKRMQLQAENAGARKRFDRAWRTIWDEFGGTTDEMAIEFVEAYKEGAVYVSFGNFNGAVTTLRELGRPDLATEIIEHFVKTQRPAKGFKYWRRDLTAGRPVDKEVEAALDKAALNEADARNPTEVLVKIIADASWSSEDIDLLNSMSPDVFYYFFRTHKGKDMGKIIKEIRNFGGPMRVNAQVAFERMAAENELDRVRLSYFHRVFPRLPDTEGA